MATIYTEEHIIGKVLEFREYWGHWPRARHARMSSILNFSRRTVHRRFGGWDEMLVKAKAAYEESKEQRTMYRCADCGYKMDKEYFAEIGGKLYCRNCKWVHLPKTKLQIGLEEAAEKLGHGCRLLQFHRKSCQATLKLPPAVINRWGETFVWEDAYLHMGLDQDGEKVKSCSLSVTSYELTTGRKHPHCYLGDTLCGGDHLGDILHYFDNGDYLGGVMNAHVGVSSYNPGHAQRQLHNIRCGVCDHFIAGIEYFCTECEQVICGNCKHQVLRERPDLAWDCICKDCKVNACENCGHKFKDSESVKCLRCRKRVCPECTTPEMNKCAICNGPEQLDGGASYMCHSCRYECTECGRTMCGGHMVGILCQECASTTCEVCGKDYIKEDGLGCSSCNKEVCPECLEPCDTCGEMFCKDCLYQCVVDQYWVCERDRNLCICGDVVCGFCCEMKGWGCAECGHPLCQECSALVDGNRYCEQHAPAATLEDKPDDEPEETLEEEER